MSTDAPIAVITGANKGLGYFTGEGLARKGYRIILVGRRHDRLVAAQETLRTRVPGVRTEIAIADFSGLTTARSGAESLYEAGVERIDVLVNNAGLIHAPRTREETPDGLELVMATNLVCQVAWLDAVFDMLASDARLVWLGSLASRIWDSAPTDIYSERAYSPWRAYTRSKIAVQVFAVELARRFAAAGSRRSSVVADPGYSLGGLTVRVPGINNPHFRKGARELLQWPFAQGKHTGAAPVIHAASAPEVASGDGWGPRWYTKGRPTRRALTRTSTDRANGLRLWDQVITDADAERLSAALPTG